MWAMMRKVQLSSEKWIVVDVLLIFVEKKFLAILQVTCCGILWKLEVIFLSLLERQCFTQKRSLPIVFWCQVENSILFPEIILFRTQRYKFERLKFSYKFYCTKLIKSHMWTILSEMGVDILNDQMLNDQYFEIWKFPMLKVTRGPVFWFLWLQNYFFIFVKIIRTLKFRCFFFNFKAPIFLEFSNLIFF